MSIRETSGYDVNHEFRQMVGLQFFAEGEEGGAPAADMDGDFGSDFEEGLLDGDLENQQDAGQNQEQGADGGLGNQQTDGQQEEPEKPQEGGQETPTEQQQQEPELVPLTYNGQQIMMPKGAVDEIGRALGMDAITLLQKGMNYDRKNERELAVLNQYAAAANLTVPQFIQQLEQRQREQEFAQEIEKLKAEFPASEEGALREIAKSRVAARRQEQMQQAQARDMQLQQLRSRVDQSIQSMQQKKIDEQWTAYENATGIHTPDKIPPRIWELVNQGSTPMEAHWQYQAEQAQSEIQKNKSIQQQAQKNTQTTTGSLAGGGVEEDAFLSGLFGA